MLLFDQTLHHLLVCMQSISPCSWLLPMDTWVAKLSLSQRLRSWYQGGRQPGGCMVPRVVPSKETLGFLDTGVWEGAQQGEGSRAKPGRVSKAP